MKRSTFLATLFAPFVAMRLAWRPDVYAPPIRTPVAEYIPLRAVSGCHCGAYKCGNGWYRHWVEGPADKVLAFMHSDTVVSRIVGLYDERHARGAETLTVSWFEKDSNAHNAQLEMHSGLAKSYAYTREYHANYINGSGRWEKAR